MMSWLWKLQVNWQHLRHTSWNILIHTSNTLLPCVTSWEKSKEINQDIRKRTVDLHKSGSSLASISRCLKVPRSFDQMIIYKYEHMDGFCRLEMNVHLVKMLAGPGKKVPRSTVKQVTWTESPLSQEEDITPKSNKPARWHFANAHRDK